MSPNWALAKHIKELVILQTNKKLLDNSKKTKV